MTTYTVDYGGGKNRGRWGWSWEGGGGGLELEKKVRRQPPLPWILGTTEEAEVLRGRRRSLELQPEDICTCQIKRKSLTDKTVELKTRRSGKVSKQEG